MTESDWAELESKQVASRSNENLSDALRNQSVASELKDLRRHVDALEAQMVAIKAERESLMRYGLMTLGAAVLGMAMYIWHLLADGRLK